VRLFDLFKKRNSSANFRPKWLLGLEAESAISAHENWKKRLNLLLSGHSTEELDETKISQDNLCDLGKWIYSDATQEIRETEEYQRLLHAHKDFHYCAGSIVADYKTGNLTSANQTLNGRYKTASEKVIFLLNKIKSTFY
jgi:hypothetical protein